MRKIIVVCVAFVVLLSGVALAYPNESNGFRQYKWGMSAEDVQKQAEINKDIVVPVNKINSNQALKAMKQETYRVNLQQRYLSGIPIVGPATFSFFNDKLNGVVLTIYAGGDKQSSEDLYKTKEKLLLSMKEMYGPPSRMLANGKGKRVYVRWEGKKSTILLSTLPGQGSTDDLILILKSPKLSSEESKWNKQVRNSPKVAGW